MTFLSEDLVEAEADMEPSTKPIRGEVWEVMVGRNKGRRMAILKVTPGEGREPGIVEVVLARLPGHKLPLNPVVRIPLDERWGKGIRHARDIEEDS
jgi:hypothetical protein